MRNPPTLEEVKSYAREIGATADPEEFFHYWAGESWMRSNGAPVKNWKRTFRNRDHSARFPAQAQPKDPVDRIKAAANARYREANREPEQSPP